MSPDPIKLDPIKPDPIKPDPIKPDPMKPHSKSPQLMHKRGAFSHFADRLGAAASFLCALHCAALPFVLALLPALGLGFLADHGFERGFIVCASLLALATLVYGYRRHHVRRAFVFLLPGLALLWIGGFLFDLHGGGLGWHSLLVALGGSSVALAHLTNLRLVHGHEHGACCEHAIV